ncbi:MAG: prephenate dehydratase [Candidatus Omnitrophica bacterium]|nr:prephenate dehydratase [Candidatus Omnitrophota bacterium]
MDISKLRSKIDTLDAQIVKLLNARAKVSIEVGKAKRSSKKGIYASDRERQVMERIKALNEGPMSEGALEAVWREIMSSSLSLEKPLRIAHLGEPGSYSHSAAVRKFGSQVSYVSSSSIPEVFHRVETGDSDYGVVPIENSVEGSVTPTADMLVDSDLQICAQLMVKITHNLLSKAPVDKIKKVYSNSQVLGQCRQWLLGNLPPDRVKEIAVASTTDAARIAAKEKGAAALASVECSRIYGVPVVRANVQDIAHNTTRFFVVARQDVPLTGRDRTSIVFSIKDHVGVLYAMLAPFAKNGINLTKIESRPIKKKAWDYYFFVDLEGHREDKKVEKALKQLEGMCKFLKILGSYPE